MVLPIAIYYLAAFAVAAVGIGFAAKPVVTAYAGGITTKAEAEGEKIKQPSSSAKSENLLGGLYQYSQVEEHGKDLSPTLEASGGGLGGQPTVTLSRSGADPETEGLPIGTKKADSPNSLADFMPVIQLLVIGVFAFLIIREVV